MTHFVAVAPDKFRKGWPDGSADYERLPLEEALTRVWATDAHLVTYVVEGDAERQPRLRKESWTRYGIPVSVGVLMVDVDNPGHREWEPGESVGAPEGAGIYLTRAGYRLVQPLTALVPPPVAERMLATWIAELRGMGVAVDERCRDWTRHFRLPHVVRDRKPYRSPLVDLTGMRPRSIAPMAEVELPRVGPVLAA